LVVDFVEGVLQLPVDGGQLFEVSVGFVDGQKDLVHFVYGLVHGGLGLEHNRKTQLYACHPIARHSVSHVNPVTSSGANIQPVVGGYESYHVEGGSCLLQEAHQTGLTEVLPSTNPFLLWRQDVIGDGRLFQYVGGDILRGKTRVQNIILKHMNLFNNGKF